MTKHHGRIKVKLNGEIVFNTKYQYDTDMYLNSIKKFFNSHSQPEIRKFFSTIKPLTLEAYEELVKKAGFIEEYDYGLHKFKTVEDNMRFLEQHQELDDRNFINPFTGYNDFEVMISTNRNYTRSIDKGTAPVDFEYTIDLDNWTMDIRTALYGDWFEHLPVFNRSSSTNN